MFQVKIGIRNIVMPGQRMHTTVVIMLTAPRMVPRPPTATARDPQVATGAGSDGVGQRDVRRSSRSRRTAGVMNPPRAISAPNR